jgi:hypothetical protein
MTGTNSKEINYNIVPASVFYLTIKIKIKNKNKNKNPFLTKYFFIFYIEPIYIIASNLDFIFLTKGFN